MKVGVQCNIHCFGCSSVRMPKCKKHFFLIRYFSNTVSLSDFIFPMNDMFNLANEPYDEHEPTKCQKAALATRHQKKKKTKPKTQAYTQMKICR